MGTIKPFFKATEEERSLELPHFPFKCVDLDDTMAEYLGLNAVDLMRLPKGISGQGMLVMAVDRLSLRSYKESDATLMPRDVLLAVNGHDVSKKGMCTSE
eukprot:GHVN01034787.1.p1 GENE.GHVN01034787.1~~GHVN01034787.1.p1  ORF type:complete len:100 (+),score=11.11 GHVN01034787.1:809-1108(+)